MTPWCGQVRGHSLFDKKFFPIPVLWVKLKKINIVYHFPQYESLRIVLCHYDLCWFLVVYGFDKLTWTWSGKTVLFRGRSWEKPARTPEPAEEVSLTAKSHTSVTPPGDYTYSKESNLCYFFRWLNLQQRVTPLLLLQGIILTTKSHTSVTPPGDNTYSKESHLLLLQVIILTAKSHTSVTPPGDYTYSKESHLVTPPGDYTYSKETNLCYSSRWLYLQQRVTPALLLQVIILTAKSHTSVTPPGDYGYSKESNLCYSSRWLYLKQKVATL
jgi:hypothetical protein